MTTNYTPGDPTSRSDKHQRQAAIIVAGCVWLAMGVALFALFDRPTINVLDRIRASGELLVATLPSSIRYHDTANGPNGFELALVEGFAEHLGVRSRFVFPPDLEHLLRITAQGTAHMAVGGLTITPLRQASLALSRPYDSVTEQLIYRRGEPRPATIADLASDDLHVIAGSSHEETLRELQRAQSPALRWTAHNDSSVDALLAALEQGDISYVVADSNVASMKQRMFRHTAIAFDLGKQRKIAWAFPRNADSSLRDAANDYLGSIEQSGLLRRLHARYFGHGGRLNFVDIRAFWRAVRDRLPSYRALFEQASEITGIDWRLLAAIGYQESHWRPEATSPTGVRGIMMLTKDTAKQMQISDRTDPAQSIIGGARYLRVVDNKIPERIGEPDRTWLTLAGYNIGFGHLEDARILTQRDDADPDSWMDVKLRLPLLADKGYHSTVKHGFANGKEPVDYVDNIRNYYDMLTWLTTTANEADRRRLFSEHKD